MSGARAWAAPVAALIAACLSGCGGGSPHKDKTLSLSLPPPAPPPSTTPFCTALKAPRVSAAARMRMGGPTVTISTDRRTAVCTFEHGNDSASSIDIDRETGVSGGLSSAEGQIRTLDAMFGVKITPLAGLGVPAFFWHYASHGFTDAGVDAFDGTTEDDLGIIGATLTRAQAIAIARLAVAADSA